MPRIGNQADLFIMTDDIFLVCFSPVITGNHIELLKLLVDLEASSVYKKISRASM
jgi:hypothetical protein